MEVASRIREDNDDAVVMMMLLCCIRVSSDTGVIHQTKGDFSVMIYPFLHTILLCSRLGRYFLYGMHFKSSPYYIVVRS